MDFLSNLLFGTGIAHSILLFAVVIATGLYLGRFQIKGVSIGSTWILFMGILAGHFGFRSDPTVLAFMKEFGLILFVFSIGLQVGPGFFHSFKKGGVLMNMLALGMILLAVLVTVIVHLVSGESLLTLTGVMSGAVTNTPGLGAAQQTVMDVMDHSREASELTSRMASAYAVAYPAGVVGVIALILLSRSVFKVDIAAEEEALKKGDEDSGETARRMHCQVCNPAVFGQTLKTVVKEVGQKFIVSRILHDGEVSVPGPDTVLCEGDRLLIVTSRQNVDTIRIIFGEEVPMHQADWNIIDEKMVTRRLVVSRSSLTGRRITELGFRRNYNVTVTRVVRSGVELMALPNLQLQMGDTIVVVGSEDSIRLVAEVVGNRPQALTKPNLVPIFFGIAIGVIFGSLPIRFPGLPQPVKFGLAGGPLIVAILLGYFGPKWKITTYTTLSANMMIREIGISFFMAAVGIGAGETFVSSLTGGGYWWILYGALITLIPVGVTILVARLAFHLNFYQICGLVSGGTTDPAVLAFAQNLYGTDYTSVNYVTVYPLSMFLRVLVAQVMVLMAL